MPTTPDLLDRALDSLALALDAARADPANDIVRDGAIQRFEYSYELAWKLIQRILKEEMMLADTGLWTRRELFRQAARHGLLTDPEAWFLWSRARNATAHVYREDVAREVYAGIPGFLEAGRGLVAAVRRLG